VDLAAAELERYRRHLALPEIGLAGQQKLKAARVLLVGAGGLGSPAALYLAAGGVGTITVIDGDRVDLTNLQRQVLYDTPAIGSAKAIVARDRLMALNPGITVDAIATDLSPANALELARAHDVVLDGSDRLATRYLVNDACVLARRPLVTAAIHRFEGQAMTYVPGRGPCYRCLFARVDEGLVPNCAEAGVLGVLPGVMGAIQATEAIKLIAGIGEPLVGRLLSYDALAMNFAEFRFARRADCAVCGDAPSITSIAPAPPPAVRITPLELRDRLARSRGAKAVHLIDVRDPREFAVRHLEGAVNIPVGDLPQRLADLPRDTPIVFLCRSGARSVAACRIAQGAGVDSVSDLRGGLLAWAAEVDPAFEVAPVP
jgi:adenylyltransferase/sulfurtransferase